MKTSVDEFAVFEDIAFTDVDDHGECKDGPVPMSLEHPEIRTGDKNQMVGVTFFLPFSSHFDFLETFEFE